MSTLRITNIEAKADPSSPTVDEKIKLTNSNGDILVHIDGKTSGITTIGINTTAGNIKFDQNSNVVVTGIITATSFSGDGSALTGIDLGAVTGATGDFSIADKIVHTGDTNTSIRFPAADTITAETGGSERLRITSAGKIGINEATPDAQLHVRGSGNSSGLTFLSEDSSGNNTFWIQDGGKVGVHYYPFAINRDSTDTIPSSTYFYVHSASPFAIKNNGAVVIGTDTAATNAEVTIRTRIASVIFICNTR